MGENGSLSDEEVLLVINEQCDGGYTVVVPYRGRKFLAVTSHGPGPTWGLWTKSDGDLPGCKPEEVPEDVLAGRLHPRRRGAQPLKLAAAGRLHPRPRGGSTPEFGS